MAHPPRTEAGDPTESDSGARPLDAPPFPDLVEPRPPALAPARAAAEQALTAELLTDPCHLLRRACQIADYGATDTSQSAEPRGRSR